MSKQVWKGSTLLGPIPPTLVSCGSMEKPNLFTVAWTGIINTIPPKTYISVRPERFSYDLIKESRDFVINLTTTDLVFATDFCGVRSGRDLDKFTLMNLDPEPASQVTSPMLKQSPISLECKVYDIIPLGSHHMFLADIVAVNVDDDLLDESGKLCLEKGKLLAFAHGQYFALGESVGTFGYSVRKKAKTVAEAEVQSAKTETAAPAEVKSTKTASDSQNKIAPKKNRWRNDKSKSTKNKKRKK